MARPSDYTDELADEICARMIESDYGLEQVCDAEDMPSARTVYRWIASNEAFCQKYARAKEVQAEVQAGRGIRDALEAKDAALGRLKYDARKWHASKLNAKKWGDKVALVGGGPDDAPIQSEGKLDVGGLSDDQLRALASIAVRTG